jgi:hypothetical protein
VEARKGKGFEKGSFKDEIDSRARLRSGSWAELVEKMRQSLKLSGNNELTSPTGNLQGRRKEKKRRGCGEESGMRK